jgi:hypothetical protein
MADAIKYIEPSESVVYTFDFADVLPSNDTALSDIGASDSTITATNYAGTDVSSTILASKTRTGKTLLVTIAALTEGQEYNVQFLGEGATSGQKFIKNLQVLCRKKISGEF